MNKNIDVVLWRVFAYKTKENKFICSLQQETAAGSKRDSKMSSWICPNATERQTDTKLVHRGLGWKRCMV